MIDNKLVSSKAVLAKIIADLDLKEDEIKMFGLQKELLDSYGIKKES